jgi:hypothetical protein
LPCLLASEVDLLLRLLLQQVELLDESVDLCVLFLQFEGGFPDLPVHEGDSVLVVGEILAILIHLFQLFEQFRVVVLAELILQVSDLLLKTRNLIVEPFLFFFVLSLLLLPIFLDLAIFCLELVDNVLPLESLSLEVSLSSLQIFLEIFCLFLSL